MVIFPQKLPGAVVGVGGGLVPFLDRYDISVCVVSILINGIEAVLIGGNIQLLYLPAGMAKYLFHPAPTGAGMTRYSFLGKRTQFHLPTY